MENWEKRLRNEFANEFRLYFDDWNVVDIERLFCWFSSELESAKQEERERIEKAIIGCMPLFAPKKTMDMVKVFLELIKPVFSLHQNSNEGKDNE